MKVCIIVAAALIGCENNTAHSDKMGGPNRDSTKSMKKMIFGIESARSDSYNDSLKKVQIHQPSDSSLNFVSKNYKQEFRFAINLTTDSVLDSIVLASSKSDDEYGLFSRVCFKINNKQQNCFNSKTVWDTIESKMIGSRKNAIDSRVLYLADAGADKFIVLFGYMFGSGREEMTIIKVDGRDIKIVFDTAYDDIHHIGDIDNDGVVDFVFRNMSEAVIVEGIGGLVTTYSPYVVFSGIDSLQVNKKLTRKYNESNYVWAGYEYNDKIGVFWKNGSNRPAIYNLESKHIQIQP